MKPFCATLPILLFLLLAVPVVSGQSTDATISGEVVDPSGNIIIDASVEIVEVATGAHHASRTNGAGIYAVSILPPGQYIVQVSKIGFKTLIKADVVLNVQSALSLNFTLPVGAASESITVEGGAVPINTTDGTVSTVVDRRFVENMPLNGRSFQTLLTLAPGVSQVPTYAGSNSVGSSGDIVVNGQRTESNYFTVDGVSVTTGSQPGLFGAGAGTSGSVPGLTALGSTQSLVSIDALQEFRSSTSTYSAEYGRTPGGNFAFSTRSGTNDFHGSLYDYFRNDVLDANNWFNDYLNTPKTKERQNDFGGTLGGPLLIPGIHETKPQTHFFFSYEGLRLDSPQSATRVPVPTDALRSEAPAALQPVLNAFPKADGGDDGLNDGFGYYVQAVSYPSTLDNSSIRVDRNFGPKLTLFGRYADSPSATTSYTAAIRQTTSLHNKTTTFGATYALSDHQSNDLRFNFTKNGGVSSSLSTGLGGAVPLHPETLPGPNGISFPNSGSKLVVTFTFASFTDLDIESAPSDQQQMNVTDTHSWLFGKHSLKAGIDWRRLSTLSQPQTPTEEFAYSSLAQVQSNTPYFAAAKAQAAHPIEPVYINFSGFLQDQWKVSPQLSLSFGVRWDVNPAPTDARGPVPYTVTQLSNLATTELAPRGSPLWKTDWLGYAPRIGAAYVLNPKASLTTVFRAGFGVFYDLGTALASDGYSGIGFLNQQTYSSASFPLTSQQVTVPAASVQAPYTAPVIAFDPHLKLPYALHYSFAVEQMLSKQESLSISYVGSGSHRLLTSFITFPATDGNPNFAPGDELLSNQGRASSSYNSLQVKYQRELYRGFQALVSYTWSHAADNSSSNFFVYRLLRASSDYDIRHGFQAALTYEPDPWRAKGWVAPLINHWATDLRIQARTALPVDVIGNQTLDPNTGLFTTYQPDLVPGQPLYVNGSAYPGGRAINYNAFAYAADGVQGDAPRNNARGFGTVEFDPAVRREFVLKDKLRLQFRAEAFNVVNHPSFGSIYNYLVYGPGLFGQAYTTLNSVPSNLNSLYQAGGPRSFQFALKVLF